MSKPPVPDLGRRVDRRLLTVTRLVEAFRGNNRPTLYGWRDHGNISPKDERGHFMLPHWRQAEYDRVATARLIALFKAHALVTKVYFNDGKVPGVFARPHHDDHFHVEVRA